MVSIGCKFKNKLEKASKNAFGGMQYGPKTDAGFGIINFRDGIQDELRL